MFHTGTRELRPVCCLVNCRDAELTLLSVPTSSFLLFSFLFVHLPVFHSKSPRSFGFICFCLVCIRFSIFHLFRSILCDLCFFIIPPSLLSMRLIFLSFFSFFVCHLFENFRNKHLSFSVFLSNYLCYRFVPQEKSIDRF